MKGGHLRGSKYSDLTWKPFAFTDRKTRVLPVETIILSGRCFVWVWTIWTILLKTGKSRIKDIRLSDKAETLNEVSYGVCV